VPIKATSKATTIKLSAMMFWQFFIWGAWFVTIGVYLTKGVNFPDGLVTAYSVGPVAAIIAPLVVGLFADRFLPVQVALGICHLLGAVLLWMIPWSISQELSGAEGTFYWLLLAYSLLYMPTLGLSSTVAMRNIESSEKQFPVIRVFGTIGWIAAGVLVGTILKADATELPFKVAAGASVILGVFSFLLPHTPPPLKGKKVSISDALGLGALGMFRDFKFLVFAIASTLIFISLQAYYGYAATYITDAGFESASGVMIWGQVSEIVFMLIIPLLLVRLGVKKMLAIGMACWFVRYALFAIAAPDSVQWMIFVGIILHGICYDFFFVTGQIYTDVKAPEHLRGQAQGLYVVLTQGIGMLIGASFNQHFFKTRVSVPSEAENATPVLTLWADFWWIPGGVAAVVLVLFLILFRDEKREPNQ